MKNILIDLNVYRECTVRSCDEPVPEGYAGTELEEGGKKTIRELAVFHLTCRRCEDAPCVEVCPEEALLKAEDGMVLRSTHRCVACKSCVVSCPFGTMMCDFYEYQRTKELYYNLKDKEEREQFIKESPEGAIILTDGGEDKRQNIYELMPGILVKDVPWERLKKLEDHG